MANTANEKQGLPLDAAELGLEGTVAALQALLAERFGVFNGDNASAADKPIFSLGGGLSSLEGIEFLCEVEKRFGLVIKDLDWWVYETPTLAAVAQYLIELSKQQTPR